MTRPKTISPETISIARYGCSYASAKNNPASVVTLGNFDGLHLGHQTLLTKVAAIGASKKLRTVVLSFYPHPAKVLGKNLTLSTLSTLRQRLKILQSKHISTLYLVHFTRLLASMSAADFCDKILIQDLNCKELLIGADARVGRDREGNAEFIHKFLTNRSVNCQICEMLTAESSVISSRTIRTLISQGDVKTASKLLGRPYSIESYVKHGDGRGAGLGFPTANLNLKDHCLPSKGVYACFAIIKDERLPAVANIGIRPTFGGSKLQLEVHVLDRQFENLYRSKVEVQFIARLRDEKKFSGPQELKLQIALDIENAKENLK